MENDAIWVDSSKLAVVEEYKSRIEKLFGVKVEVYTDEHGESSCQFYCPSEDDYAQENLDKAKRYLEAFLADGPGFSITTEVYELETVAMILKNQDEIEQQSATVLTAKPDLKDVKLQGQIEDILLAKKLIQVLLSEKSVMPLKLESETGLTGGSFSRSGNVLSSSHYGQDATNVWGDLKSDCPSMIDTYGIEGQNHSDCSENLQETMNNKIQLHQNFPLTDFHSSFAHLKMTSDSSDSSDDEEAIRELQQGPEYNSKLEFALKLGYDELDLLKVLKKLGPNAGQNDLLSELIKQGAAKGDNDDNDTDPTLFSPSDPEESPELMYERKRVSLDESTSKFRHIIIDGSNVAMSHGNKEVFSCKGIELAVDWFRQRGHSDITVFVPQWRKETSKPGAIKDQSILTKLEREKVLVFTPARRIGGRRVVCYDDRYILKLAVETDGIVVSNDNYRDLIGESEEFKKIIEERLLMYSFVNNRFMPPDDPLGRNGPTLENFLLKEPLQPDPLPPRCPYGSKKCTYGNKCKYYHPERKNLPHKLVSEKLAEQAKLRMQEREKSSQMDGKKKLVRKTSLHRTKSLNPGEPDTQQSFSDLTSTLSMSVSNLDTKDDEKYLLYNQKMADNRRKMEEEHSRYEQQYTGHVRLGEKREIKTKPVLGEHTADAMAGPWQQGIDVLKGERSRGASPISNLSVPGHVSNPENCGPFISGHLLLAKKLSDEANESDKLKLSKSEADSQFNSNQMFQLNSVRGQSPESNKQKQKHPPVKQKLSRQLSLQGKEDPRLRQGHKGLQAQYSYDPRRVTMGDPFISNSDYAHPFDQNPGNLLSESFGHSRKGLSHFDEPSYGHTALSRMQSAPDPFVLQQHQKRPVPMVMRQNSSSDTQLNKLEGIDQGVGGHFAENMSPRGIYGEQLLSRGTLPMKDTTGSVTFQIGGPLHPSPQVPHCRSMGALNQQYQGYSPVEMDYRYQQQFHQTQHHPQVGNNFGDMSHTNVSYTSASPMMPQKGYGSNGYMTNSQALQDNRQFLDQSSIWDNNLPNQTNISMPGNYGPMNVSQGFPMSSHSPSMGSPRMSPHTPEPTNFHQQSQHLHHHQQQLQQEPVFIPQQHLADDAPIPESDPRYNTYYHLCKLFPEEKVRAVMNQYPNTDDPKEICSYLVTL